MITTPPPPCIILAFIPFQHHPPSPCSLFSLLCINSSSLFCIFFILPVLYLISFWIYKTLSYFSPGTSTGPPFFLFSSTNTSPSIPAVIPPSLCFSFFSFSPFSLPSFLLHVFAFYFPLSRVTNASLFLSVFSTS